ncbi:MAG: N-acetyltransferase family protein [Polyangiales bacterium]
MTTATVRDFEARDVAPANALTNHFIVHTTTHFGAAPAADGDFAALWEKGHARFPWLAAEADGRFAGYAKAGVWREREAYAKTAEAGIYVADGLRGRGVGRALYGELLARLRAAGFHAVVAGVTLPNEASVRLHEAMGFRAVGVFRDVGRKFGAWHDVGFWQLTLG